MSLVRNILCKRGEFWHLLSWDTEKRAGSLIVGKTMPRDGNFVSASASHDGQRIDSTRGITLYPELHYRGAVVHPVAWHPDSAEPVLKVLAGRWLRKVSPDEAAEIMQSLRQQGWEFDHHHGSGGYVHVEDPGLEKIEGPPPAGAF